MVFCDILQKWCVCGGGGGGRSTTDDDNNKNTFITLMAFGISITILYDGNVLIDVLMHI